jgi:hypothetical protein
LGKLRELISQYPKMKEAETKQSILVMAAGEWVKNPKTGKREQTIKDQEKVDLLTLAIKAELGKDVEIQLQPYSEKVMAGVKDWGVMCVRIPPKNQAAWHTWFSRGSLGKKEK